MGDISGSFSMMMISVSSRGTGEKAITALVYGYLLFFSFFSSVFILALRMNIGSLLRRVED